MRIYQLSTPKDFEEYGAWVRSHSQRNLWQSVERKKYVESTGKQVRIYVERDNDVIVASALVAIDTTSFGLSTWEIARGPIGSAETLMQSIASDAKKSGCMALYFSPVMHKNYPIPSSSHSSRHIHCEATRIIDIAQSKDEILKQMKPKGRYNIRVAEKHDVTVQQSDDIKSFYTITKETGQRDNFITLSQEHYSRFLTDMPNAFLLLAYKKNKPIAGLLGVVWNGQGIYYYGCSLYAHRALMAPYLLQWKAMQHCKENGCTSYDLLGIAPENADSNHPWSGITSFKEKFGGEIVSYPPEQCILLRPVAHALLHWKRKLWR